MTIQWRHGISTRRKQVSHPRHGIVAMWPQWIFQQFVNVWGWVERTLGKAWVNADPMNADSSFQILV
jgi:hypothetical protein